VDLDTLLMFDQAANNALPEWFLPHPAGHLGGENTYSFTSPLSQENVQEDTENNAEAAVDVNNTNAVVLQEEEVNGEYAGLSAETNLSDSLSEWPCMYPGCDKVFEKRFKRNKHHQIHDPKHRCPFCPKKFPVKRDM